MPLLLILAAFATTLAIFGDNKPVPVTGQQAHPRNITQPEPPVTPETRVLDDFDSSLARLSASLKTPTTPKKKSKNGVAQKPLTQKPTAQKPIAQKPTPETLIQIDASTIIKPKPESPDFVEQITKGISPQSTSDDCYEAPVPPLPPLENIQRVVAGLGCPTSAERNLNTVKHANAMLFSDSMQFGAKSAEVIHGVTLRGSSSELRIAKEILGSMPPSAFAENAKNCEDVRCALTAAFGDEEAALLAMNLAKKYGYSPTVSQHENIPGRETVWSADQLRRLDKHLESLPNSFRKNDLLEKIVLVHPDSTPTIQTRHHVSVSEFSGVWVSEQKAIFLVDDSAYARPGSGLEHTFIHELAHAYDTKNGDSEGHNFGNLSGFDAISNWRANPAFRAENPNAQPRFLNNPAAGYVTDYAKDVDPGEDFADSVALYQYASRYSERLAPEKYRFLRDKVFKGQEFKNFGKKPWPELDQRIQSAGGCSALVQKCLQSIRDPLRNSDGTLWWSDPKSQYMLSSEQMIRNTNCFSKTAEEFGPDLKSSAGYCEQDGVEGIEKNIRATCATELTDAIMDMRELIKNPVSSVATYCWSQGDFTHSCYSNQLLKAQVSDRDPSKLFWTQSPAIAQTLVDKAANGMTTRASDQIFKSVQPADVVFSCLLGMDEIGSTGQGLYFRIGRRPTVEFDGPGCRSKLMQRLRQAGLKLDSDVVTSSLLSNPASVENLRGFQSEVASKFRAANAACRNDNCTQTVTRTLLLNWARVSQFSDARITPEFVRQISTKLAR